jgi:hypothetical protein
MRNHHVVDHQSLGTNSLLDPREARPLDNLRPLRSEEDADAQGEIESEIVS